MNTLDGWVDAVAAELGLPGTPDVAEVLALARDVAHSVARPAAPLTTWLAGMAVAEGADPLDVASRIRRIAASWEP